MRAPELAQAHRQRQGRSHSELELKTHLARLYKSRKISLHNSALGTWPSTPWSLSTKENLRNLPDPAQGK